MIIDAAQLLHFKTILGVMDCDSVLSKQHATLHIGNLQEEAHVLRDINCVQHALHCPHCV
jgi:hypothetical protein